MDITISMIGEKAEQFAERKVWPHICGSTDKHQ